MLVGRETLLAINSGSHIGSPVTSTDHMNIRDDQLLKKSDEVEVQATVIAKANHVKNTSHNYSNE